MDAHCLNLLLQCRCPSLIHLVPASVNSAGGSMIYHSAPKLDFGDNPLQRYFFFNWLAGRLESLNPLFLSQV